MPRVIFNKMLMAKFSVLFASSFISVFQVADGKYEMPSQVEIFFE